MSISHLIDWMSMAVPALAHKDRSIHLERAYMHCKGIACTRSFGMGLTLAEGQARVF